MMTLSRKEILTGLRNQGIHGFRTIAKACRNFEAFQLTRPAPTPTTRMVKDAYLTAWERKKIYSDINGHLGHRRCTSDMTGMIY